MAGINQIITKGIGLVTKYADDAARVASTAGDDVARYVKACGKTSVLQTKPVNPKQLKGLRFASDAVGDTLTRSPRAKIFADFSKKITGVQNGDDLTILAQEFKKIDLDDVMKQELISQYISKYESFYNQLYTGKTFEPKVLFKQIFSKEISDEIAQTLCSKYKEILAEPDFNKFLEQLFIQVKKDFGLDYFESSLKKIPQAGRDLEFSAGSSKYLDFIQFKFFEDNPINRRKAFELMMHEVNHMKQNEISLATNAQEYINALAKVNGCSPLDISKKIGAHKIYDIMQKLGKIPKESPLYDRGMRYIESSKNYFSPKGDFTTEKFLAYKRQFNEAESYAVQDRAGELFYFLTGNSI